MKIGLYFGSFNPIHIGHLIIADTIVEQSELDRVWFVVSPLSPFKKENDLLHHFDRLDMVQLAIEGNGALAVTDVEFGLPQPNYTIHTLDVLKAKQPQHQFSLIMGEDNLTHLHKWKDGQRIADEFGIYCYPRPGAKKGPLSDHQNVKHIVAPLLDISATEIRNRIKAGKTVRYLIPEQVETYIRLKKFYT